MPRFVLLVSLAAVAAWPAQAQPEVATVLNLTCSGQGAFTIANFEKDDQGRYKDDKRVQVEGRVRVRVSGEQVSIRMPATMPGGDAWRTASSVQIDADQIRGRFQAGLLSTAAFNINRRSGDIDIKGPVRFDGTCEKAPDESAPAKF